MKRKLTRRDLCDLVGRRAADLSERQSLHAWRSLAYQLELIGHVDSGHTPKFNDVLKAIRKATIDGVNWVKR